MLLPGRAVIYAATIPESEKRRRGNERREDGGWGRVVQEYRPLHRFYLPPVVRGEIVPQNCSQVLASQGGRYYFGARRCNRASENALEAEICLFSTPRRSRCAIIIAALDTSGNGCKYERVKRGAGRGRRVLLKPFENWDLGQFTGERWEKKERNNQSE